MLQMETNKQLTLLITSKPLEHQLIVTLTKLCFIHRIETEIGENADITHIIAVEVSDHV